MYYLSQCFSVLVVPRPAHFRCIPALLQLPPCSIICPCVFKPVFSPHSLTARLCLLCPCAWSLVLMCPRVSSMFPALFSMASGLSSVLYFSTVFLCAFLCPCFVVCILDFGLWLSAYHSSSLFELFYLPASVCLHLDPRHFTNVYDERVNITFYRRLWLRYETS